ncbi:hypothetical protein NDU88_000435 [Pleurodeles waltl]|uniref:Uncharacterized protein n=1 Tax=Pleurodeles waltl TaxID=8319 RepID=A0AAV7UPY5_PLEWA|nr:hypothetical protein NDU88_001960 [Pleurodeles waltl]KAJ1187323.1 hypothetical protein NDU88_004100 [Pleurodeles waltl]KAJ1191119.1 hypothetical protein NDU88_000435 [Pleurodeles waltl]
MNSSLSETAERKRSLPMQGKGFPDDASVPGRSLQRNASEERRAPQERSAGEPNVLKERSALPVKREAALLERKNGEES